MIEIKIEMELPNTNIGNGKRYLHALNMYKKWFKENNIIYELQVRYGNNDLVTISEQDALLFRLKFGI